MTHNKLPYDCLIPAAGMSTRMGQWKLVLPVHDNCSLLERTVETALSVCKRVIVIGGFRFGEMQKMLSSFGEILLLENRDYEKGMLSSIQCGLNAVERDFFITPADMPGITEEHYQRLDSSFDGNKIVRPVFEQKPGHPILCPYSCKEKILALKGERLFSAFKNWDQLQISWEDDSTVADIDTEEDLVHWRTASAVNRAD